MHIHACTYVIERNASQEDNKSERLRICLYIYKYKYSPQDAGKETEKKTRRVWVTAGREQIEKGINSKRVPECEQRIAYCHK